MKKKQTNKMAENTGLTQCSAIFSTVPQMFVIEFSRFLGQFIGKLLKDVLANLLLTTPFSHG